MTTSYTASVEYSLDGGKTYRLYYDKYSGSLATSAFTALLPISGSRSAIFRTYRTGSAIGSAFSETQFFYAGGTKLQFTSYYRTYEHKYMCVVKRGEFNSTLNPSLYDTSGSIYDSQVQKNTWYEGSGGESKNLITTIKDENFHTFTTGIGLYDDAMQLVAYAKFANPIKIDKNFDSVFIVKFDA